jgi:hypothetical protein
MIFLIHLLEQLGLPSGVAFAVVVGARKLVKGVVPSHHATCVMSAHPVRQQAEQEAGATRKWEQT